jgi:hypothetical protein
LRDAVNERAFNIEDIARNIAASSNEGRSEDSARKRYWFLLLGDKARKCRAD